MADCCNDKACEIERLRAHQSVTLKTVFAINVVMFFLVNWPGSADQITVNLAELLFVLAVLANVAYCAAYLVDVAVQSSAFRSSWKHYRWMLFALGVLFASILAQFFAAKMFSDGAP